MDGGIDGIHVWMNGWIQQMKMMVYYQLSILQPERINISQSPSGYDVRADVWSLGITLVELATGSSPYDSQKFKNEFQLLTHIVQAPPPLLNKDKFSENFYDFVAQW